MAFSTKDPPRWFRMIVAIALVILAAGLFLIVTRNGIGRRVARIEAADTKIIELLDARSESLDELVLALEGEDDPLLQAAGTALKPLLLQDSTLLMHPDERSAWYDATDRLVNEVVPAAVESYGNVLPQALLRPIREIMDQEGELIEFIAVYQEELLLHRQSLKTVFNLPAAALMHLPDYREYTISDALKTPY